MPVAGELSAIIHHAGRCTGIRLLSSWATSTDCRAYDCRGPDSYLVTTPGLCGLLGVGSSRRIGL